MASGYVISSADFGRAYLSEGWATRFVKALRERYTIVLLGYRAEDHPINRIDDFLPWRWQAARQESHLEEAA